MCLTCLYYSTCALDIACICSKGINPVNKLGEIATSIEMESCCMFDFPSIVYYDHLFKCLTLLVRKQLFAVDINIASPMLSGYC